MNKTYSLVYKPPLITYQQSYDQDEFQSIWDISLRKNKDFDQVQTYSYGFWLKWSFVYPKIIDQQEQWYSICRLTSRENHSDYSHPQDRDLSIWMSKEFFHFTTYTIDYPEKFYNVNYTKEQLDGIWNFVYFGYNYDESLARGYILFNQEQFQEALIPAKHFKQQYIRFLIKREFQNKAFNGYYSNIFLSINENPLKSEQEILKLVQQKNCLLSNLNQIFQQYILIDTQQEVIYDESKFQQFYYKDIDPQQFSVSGWLKFENPVEFKDSNFVVRLSHNQKGDQQQWYDKIMFLKQVENNYQFETYDCEFGCRILDWQIKTENQDKLWHFVYMAFDQNQKKIFQFWKFDQQAFIILKEQIYHYQIHGLYLNLQKDDFTPGYNGQMKRWTFNYGNGAYREEGFEDDTLLQQSIGLKNFLTLNQTELWKFQQNDLDIDYQNIQDLQENEIDPSSFKIDSNEYGYGFWMKFIYNKQSSKINSLTNKTLGVSRFGTAQQYKQKNNLGQNTLSILLQTNKIIFQTYTILDENQKDFQIKHYLDNQWLYVYNGYKRVFEKQGVFLGCVYDEIEMLNCIQSQNDIVHFKIENYMFFSVGSLGIKQNDLLHFNGFIKDAKLYFGVGSIYPKYHEFQHESIPCNQNWITKVVQQYNVDRLDYNPSDFKLTDFVDEYSIQLWFKNQGNNEVDDQFVFILSHDENSQHQEPGGLVLSTKLNKQNNIFILSQTFNEEDYYSLIEKEIQIVKEQDIKQWTYIYVAYKQQNCYYFIQTKTQRFNQIFDCIHQSSNHYYLFKGSDGRNNKFLGDLDYLKVDFGQGSFLTEFNFLSESFKMGLKLFPTTFKWKQNQKTLNLSFNKLNLAQNFKTNDKISMDGQKNYGFGFWSRFLTEFPSIFINEDNFIIISSLLSNQVQKKELEIISLYLSPDKSQYKIKTYDLNQKKYKFGTFDFQSSQEGIWNYIYVSYSADFKQLVGFIHHQQEKRVMRITLNDIHHNSINGNVDFILGKYFNFPGFNGQISNLLVSFDGDSFIDQISSFQEIILSNQLQIENDQFQKFNFIKLNQKALFYEQQINLKEDYFPTEYSIFGWFRPNMIEKISNSIKASVISESEKFEYQILKLISNKDQIDQYRNRFNIKITQNGYQFSTYSIVQDSPASSWLQNILLNPNFGTWCYFWMGYSEKLQQVSVQFKILEQTETKLFYDIKHFLTNHLQIIFSSIKEDAFDGDYSQIGMEIGEGSFKNKNELLPEYNLNLQDQAFNYQNLNGDFEKVNRLNLIEGKNSLIGSTEYSVYLWARWLHEISDNSFLDKNNLFRLARTIKYEDCEDQGDRILMVQITNQHYSFISYDVEETECSINKNLNYENMLEGQWNFIYFGYQNQVNYLGAKGYIYFSKSQTIKEVEFKIEHLPLANAAVLSLGQNEFSYGKFYGQMYQVMVTIGYGFIQDHSKLLELTSLPEKDLNVFVKHNLIQQESSLDQLQNTQYKILVQLQNQYSIFGWFKIQQFTEFGKFSVLIRISSNPELKGELGDDTLVILINDKTIQFRSYSFIPVIQNNQEMNEVIKNIDFIENQNSQWAFFYYGYNFNSNQLLMFLKFNEDLHEYQEKIDDIYHYLPLEFYAFIGQDNIYSKYYGLMDDLNFLVGESSYIEQNIYKTLGSLNRKYVENVLK